MESHFNPQICSRGILSKKFEDFNDNLSNDSSSTISSINEEDEEDEVNSSSPSSPLQNMSSLLQQLPFKRGLSKHYNGKSQSFTSLTQVGCLEDLAKPENPYNKKLKTCKSYGVFPRNNNTTICFRQIERRESNNNRGSHFGNSRPPTIPTPYNRSASTSNFTNQTPLFI